MLKYLHGQKIRERAVYYYYLCSFNYLPALQTGIKMIAKLDNDQFKALSNIMADIGQISLGSSVVISGLVISFGFWILSIIFAKRRRP